MFTLEERTKAIKLYLQYISGWKVVVKQTKFLLDKCHTVSCAGINRGYFGVRLTSGMSVAVFPEECG